MTDSFLKMYNLVVGCLFRNESDSIVEWIEHYLARGVDHLYLIDDDSDDHSVERLGPYLEKKLVTVFHTTWGRYLGRQRDMYNHYLLPRLEESKWWLIVDMDEYMWCPPDINMYKYLEGMCSRLAQIQVDHTIFGSSGYIEQPKEGIVKSFVHRSTEIKTQNPGNSKYFIQTRFGFTSLNVHHASFKNQEDEETRFMKLNETYFRLNHYSCQSREFWIRVKCTRGDGDAYRQRSMEEFEYLDQNDVLDTDLRDQLEKKN